MIYFAIGDIHGEAFKLRRLHGQILRRIETYSLGACIIHLGDYVDRGPDSRGVVEQVMALQRQSGDQFRVLSLKGNHDDRTSDWSAEKTQQSGLTGAQLAWLQSRPTQFHDTKRRLAFVHAGIDPLTFPNCSDYTRTRTRALDFFDRSRWPARSVLEGLTVVHGHTVEGQKPIVHPHRINVDTGACFGGPLTAVELRAGAAPRFLQA